MRYSRFIVAFYKYNIFGKIQSVTVCWLFFRSLSDAILFWARWDAIEIDYCGIVAGRAAFHSMEQFLFVSSGLVFCTFSYLFRLVRSVWWMNYAK